MTRFVSEAITPLRDGGGLDTGALAEGRPALPGEFRWRGRNRTVQKVLDEEKDVRVESFSGERYLKRHTWRLLMDGGEIWSVYFVRHAKAGRPKGPRWFLKTIEAAEMDAGETEGGRSEADAGETEGGRSA